MNASIISVLVVFGLWIVIYFGSRIQMKAWLHELDRQLGDKFTGYVNNKNKKENDNEEKK